MRHLAILRLAAILLLAALPLVAPAFAPAPSAAVALADNGNGNENSDDGDENRGHGNDPDKNDEDNPGKGNGKKDKDDKDEEETGVAAVPAGYVIDVACDEDADAGTTECVIAATAPEGGKKVGFVQVPADALCAEVVETDAELADPEPHTHVTGYKSRGSEGSLALVLDGTVTTAGTATYWIKAGGSVIPVEGPGFSCGVAADTAATVTLEIDVTPTATEAPAAGTVVVDVLTCADVPADTTDFDWFGQCQPDGATERSFTLTPDGGTPMTATTAKTGEATFADVAPGDYALDLVDGSWCHAVSDRVTAESKVVVEAGVTSTVWIFVCEPPTGS